MTQELFDQIRAESLESLKMSGLSMADVMMLPDTLRDFINWIMRQQEVSVAAVADYIGEGEEVAQQLIELLLAQGFLQQLDVEGVPRYRLRLAAKQKRQLPKNIWQALDSGDG